MFYVFVTFGDSDSSNICDSQHERMDDAVRTAQRLTREHAGAIEIFSGPERRIVWAG